MTTHGPSYPNTKRERNARVLAAFRAGLRMQEIADIYDILRERGVDALREYRKHRRQSV